MEKIYSTILVIVRKTGDMDLFFEKAITIANQLDCHLHVVYDTSPSWTGKLVNFFTGNPPNRKPVAKLQQWQMESSSHLNHGLKLQVEAIPVASEQAIAGYISGHHIDMIWIEAGAANDRNVKMIAGMSGIPVVMTSKQSHSAKGKNILLPVSQHVSHENIRVAIYLARKFHSQIHLVTGKRNDGKEMEYIKRIFWIIKDNTNVPIVYQSADTSSAGSLQSLAETVDADFILPAVTERNDSRLVSDRVPPLIVTKEARQFGFFS